MRTEKSPVFDLQGDFFKDVDEDRLEKTAESVEKDFLDEMEHKVK